MTTPRRLRPGLVLTVLCLAQFVDAQKQGLASGLLNTSQQVGGALGLAVLATLAAWHTTDLIARGRSPLDALNGGFSVGFTRAVVLGLLAAAVALAAPGRELMPPPVGAHEDAAPAPQAPTAPPVVLTPARTTHDRSSQ